jgi:hypothetical protein
MDVKEVASDFVNGLMEAEFELFIGRNVNGNELFHQ